MTRRRLFVALLLLSLPPLVLAAGVEQGNAVYERVLARFVKDAHVDYAALKADPKDLDDYLNRLTHVKEAEFRR